MPIIGLEEYADRVPNSNRVTGATGKPLAQGEKSEQITRQGAAAAEADFDIDSYDLSESLWQMPDDTDLDSLPDIGGTEVCAIWLVSSDDAQFEVEVEPKNDLGDGVYSNLGVIDKNVDSRFQSTSPTGKNHHIYEVFEVPSDVVKITVKNTNSPAQNVVNGTFNFH